MSPRASAPEECFGVIVKELRRNPNVTPPSVDSESKKRFGSLGLRIHGKIFAMLVRDGLVVKLPLQRVDELVASQQGKHFDPRHDARLMREWLSVPPNSDLEWLSLAIEAMEFAASAR